MARALRHVVGTYLRSNSAPASLNQIRRSNSSAVAVGAHTLKWMQNLDKKSPMEYINEVPPIVCEERVVACIGSDKPALGHPVEYILLKSDEPSVCKYCGLRYLLSDHHHGGH